MAISFDTSKPTLNRKKMHAPNEAESVGDLIGFNEIKKNDLDVGTSLGKEPSVKRTGINLLTFTFLHGGEGGSKARMKLNRNKEG